LDERWGLNKDKMNFDPKMKTDKTFNKKRFYSQKNTKSIYDYPIKSSDVYGWFEPIDDMVFLGNEREKMPHELACCFQKKPKKQNII
jgi:hypothetical protein